MYILFACLSTFKRPEGKNSNVTEYTKAIKPIERQ